MRGYYNDTYIYITAPSGRNAEDLGVEIFTKSPNFTTTFPLIDGNWALAELDPSKETPCSYDWHSYRYCAQLKTVIRSSSSAQVGPTAVPVAHLCACSRNLSDEPADEP